MSARINFSVWGRGTRDLKMPAYAMDDGVEPKGSRVAKAIARANGLIVCTVRQDGTELDRRGKPAAHRYQATIGHKCRGGGYTPTAELWFSIPVED